MTLKLNASYIFIAFSLVVRTSSSIFPSISADGRYVAFQSYATNLVPGDTNAQPDIFVHDRDPDGIADLHGVGDHLAAGRHPGADAVSSIVPSIFPARHEPLVACAFTTRRSNASVSLMVPPEQLRSRNGA